MSSVFNTIAQLPAPLLVAASAAATYLPVYLAAPYGVEAQAAAAFAGLGFVGKTTSALRRKQLGLKDL